MRCFLVLSAMLMSWAFSQGREPIRLANHPALSPDGQQLAFDWGGDIWITSTQGGLARPLTTNPAKDTSPKFSPDGKEIAFISDREGTPQIFVIPVTGGTPKQMTFHTAGYTLYEWTPDGKGWLVGTTRDHGWARRNNDRLQIVHRWDNVQKRPADTLLFDDYAANGTLAADGKSVLFTREGPEWWRKGYTGSQSSQLWSYNLEQKSFQRLSTGDWDARWPMFGKNGAVYFAQGSKTGFQLTEWKEGKSRTMVKFPDDSTVFPTISRDGSTIVFRHLFDFYSIQPGADEKPRKIELFRDDDRTVERIDRKVLTSATAAAFTSDGLEIAFIAGGDVWVMDTELKDPRRVTSTPEEERSVIWAPDGKALYFVSDAGGSPEIWKATKTEAGKPWFLSSKFNLEKITDNGQDKSRLTFSPEGSKMAYIEGRGNLIVADADGKNARKFIESWNAPQYDWSPDGKWMVYAHFDNDFNQDIWIQPLDGSRPRFNLSRHPYNDSNPVWSPDGKMIAFVGDRDDKDNSDIHYVWLRAQDEEKNARDRALEKAMEKMLKGKTKKDPMSPPMPMEDRNLPDQDEQQDEPKKKDPMPPVGKKEAGPVVVSIDFEGIHDRIKRITIANTNESNLFWSSDSKKLAFNASVEGQSGTYTVEFPDNLRPSQISSSTGSGARWLKSGSIVWLSGGRPASFSPGLAAAPAAAPSAPALGGRAGRGAAGGAGAGASTATSGGYSFTCYQDIDLAKKHQAAFDVSWRQMRDGWYDEKMGNHDWNAVRQKYRGMAETTDGETLTTVIQMMLGELNGSHLGFFYGSTSLPSRRPGASPEEPTTERNWRLSTQHLGVRFNANSVGGLVVRDVAPDSPADQKRSKLNPGDTIVSIDGVTVDPQLDSSLYFNVGPGHEFRLKVKDPQGKERDVLIRPTTFTAVRSALYKKWIADNRKMVEKLSQNKLGYLHINAMDTPSFRKFEEALYDAGEGKEGLVIDVRENGGGSTADLLLTALTQPQHAIAVPRGGGQGYPQDRTVFATWTKPIVVLCNQNSFSNAEIFSHAVKVIKRGHVVGVPTAGGVISTGGTSIMDVGFLRMPFRGWYVIDTGEDMELNGAVPHHIVWPTPGDAARGIDAQIEKGVTVLLEDVKAWQARPQPKLKKATDRP